MDIIKSDPVKKIKLLKTQIHPKGNIEKDSIYNWNEKTGFYEFIKDGKVISTVNESGVEAFTELFIKI